MTTSPDTTPQPAPTPDALAQAFHEAYETLAPLHGYKTREASAVPWEDVPAQNKGLMVTVAAKMLEQFWPAPEEPVQPAAGQDDLRKRLLNLVLNQEVRPEDPEPVMASLERLVEAVIVEVIDPLLAEREEAARREAVERIRNTPLWGNLFREHREVIERAMRGEAIDAD